MTHRVHNFTAGPCTLPLAVLGQAQRELLDYRGSGMSVMEISHRGELFQPLHEETIVLAQEIIGAPPAFQCLLLQGGGHGQFAMSAMNLMANGEKSAIINSGHWASRAMSEARRVGVMHEAWSGESSGFTTLPSEEEIDLPAKVRYLHVTSNETIGGIQFRELPDVGVPLVVDASSDYYTRAIPWTRCDIVYGGAQKNLAAAGLTVVFVRKSLLEDHPHLPKILNYKTHADTNSLYNTPPAFQIYLFNLVLKWILKTGGLSHCAAEAKEKSDRLYAAIDKSSFYRNTIDPAFRSRSNIVFRTPSSELDRRFWREAEKRGLHGLKGHRAVGGLRASLYLALDRQSVSALIEYLGAFEKANT